jgi:hypothetical protein
MPVTMLYLSRTHRHCALQFGFRHWNTDTCEEKDGLFLVRAVTFFAHEGKLVFWGGAPCIVLGGGHCGRQWGTVTFFVGATLPSLIGDGHFSLGAVTFFEILWGPGNAFLWDGHFQGTVTFSINFGAPENGFCGAVTFRGRSLLVGLWGPGK